MFSEIAQKKNLDNINLCCVNYLHNINLCCCCLNKVLSPINNVLLIHFYQFSTELNHF